MTIPQIRVSVTKSLTEGNGWPPSLPEFIALGSEQVDFEGAYFRCLNKKPDGRIEQHAYERVYFNVRASSDDKARQVHKRAMKDAVELDRRGELKLNEDELKALPIYSVKNMNDLERERWNSEHKELNPIVAKILESKK